VSKAIGHDLNSAARVDVPIVGFKRPSYGSMIDRAATRKKGLCERPLFSITKRDGRSVVVFKRDGVLEG
jgi:hypothetical protein